VMRIGPFLTHRLIALGALMILGCVSVLAACAPGETVQAPGPSSTLASRAPVEVGDDLPPTLATLPVGRPVDLVTRTAAPWIFTPTIAGTTIAYAETAEWTVGLLGHPPVPGGSGTAAVGADTVEVHAFDLLTGTDRTVISPTDLPKWKNYRAFPSWGLAALPVPKDEAGAHVYFGLVDPDYSGNGVPRLQGLLAVLPGTTPSRIIPESALVLPFIRTGDVLALPADSPEFEAKNLGNVGTTLGEKLLVLTGNLQEPVEVDPTHPTLSEKALQGLSPYASWLNFYHQGEEYFPDYYRSDLLGRPLKIYDLRDGSLVDIQIDHPTPPVSVTGSSVADHWAAWTVYEGDPQRQSLYLADLDHGKATRVEYRKLGQGFISFGDLALSRDWLLWLEPMPEEVQRDQTGRIAGYGDWQLVGYHLPDLAPVLVPHVVTAGERGTLQVSGDIAMLYVRDREQGAAVNFTPAPQFTTIRAVRLR
jgi:hypothetical protein